MSDLDARLARATKNNQKKKKKKKHKVRHFCPAWHERGPGPVSRSARVTQQGPITPLDNGASNYIVPSRTACVLEWRRLHADVVGAERVTKLGRGTTDSVRKWGDWHEKCELGRTRNFTSGGAGMRKDGLGHRVPCGDELYFVCREGCGHVCAPQGPAKRV